MTHQHVSQRETVQLQQGRPKESARVGMHVKYLCVWRRLMGKCFYCLMKVDNQFA